MKTTSSKPRKVAAKQSRPVVVTTTGNAVFYGHTDEDGRGDTIALTGARHVYYWAAWPDGGGFLALPSRGPAAGSKIGTTCARVVLRNVASVGECTEAAAAQFEAATWAR